MKSKLAILRNKRGLSQRQLAIKSGVPTKSIQFYEQSPTKIDGAKLNTLCKLSVALECKIEDIIEGAELKEKYKEVR